MPDRDRLFAVFGSVYLFDNTLEVFDRTAADIFFIFDIEETKILEKLFLHGK